MLLSAEFPPREGMGYYAWNLARCLVRRGHPVQLITRRTPGHGLREEVDGITIWRPVFLPLYPFHVHLHSLFVARVIRFLEAEVDIFHCHSPLIPPIQTKRPVMLTFHSTVRDDIRATKITSAYTLAMKLQAPVSFRLEAAGLKTASQVNAVSPKVADHLKTYPHCPPQVPVVWNAVDTEIFTPGGDRRARAGSRELYILVVGRLGPGKGVEDLVEAVSLVNRFQKCRVIVIGDGPAKAALEQRCISLNMQDQFQFVGHVADRNRLARYYQRAALFVLPSHHEGLPTVLLEAMASGCPVVATAVGGVPDVVEDGVNGLLVQPQAPQDLAAAMRSLLADPQRMEALGWQARQSIEKRFSWENSAARFLSLYSQLAGSQGS